ncbi:MAG: MFS transporter [Chloroflexota bacterium]
MAESVKSAVSGVLKYRWVILGVCWLAYIVAFMQRLSIGPLAPFLKDELNLTSAQAGLLMSAAAFGNVLMYTPAGWLADRVGVRRLLLIGEIVGGVFIASMFFINTLPQGLIFMALAGLGMGFLMPSTTKAVVEWFPVKERATAMGLKQTALNLGGIITAATLPSVALAWSWRYGFLGIGIVGIIIGVISFALYREPPRTTDSSTMTKAVRLPPKTSLREIFKSRDIWLVIFTGFCMCIVEWSVMAHFVLYAKEALLLSVVTAGLFLGLLEGGGAFARPLSGLISDRIYGGSRKWLYFLMCAVAAIASVIFAFLPLGSPTWIVVLLGFTLGVAGIGWAGLHLTLIGEFAGRERAGVATGMASTITVIGNIVGPPVFGRLVDVTGSYRMSWQFLAVAALVGAIALIFVREGKRRL